MEPVELVELVEPANLTGSEKHGETGRTIVGLEEPTDLTGPEAPGGTGGTGGT